MQGIVSHWPACVKCFFLMWIFLFLYMLFTVMLPIHEPAAGYLFLFRRGGFHIRPLFFRPL